MRRGREEVRPVLLRDRTQEQGQKLHRQDQKREVKKPRSAFAGDEVRVGKEVREHAAIATAGPEEDQRREGKKAQLDGGEDQALQVKRAIAQSKSQCEASQKHQLIWPKEDQEITVFDPRS